MRLASQFSRMNCHTFSWGLSSGHLAGSGTMVMFGGTFSATARCQPASRQRKRCAEIDEERGVGAGRDLGRDLLQVQVHGLCVAARQNERGSLAFPRADRAEDIGRGGALVLRRARPCAALGPATGDRILLSDAGFVGEPDFYAAGVDALFAPDLLQARGETFLKSSMAPSACA
jgi:hypothetical protein